MQHLSSTLFHKPTDLLPSSIPSNQLTALKSVGFWKESIIVPIHKKGDRMDCNNYRGFSLLSTSYKILSNILLSRMTPYANKIKGEYQRGFTKNRSTVDHIFSIRQILEKKWEYNKDVYQLFIDFEKAYDSL